MRGSRCGSGETAVIDRLTCQSLQPRTRNRTCPCPTTPYPCRPETNVSPYFRIALSLVSLVISQPLLEPEPDRNLLAGIPTHSAISSSPSSPTHSSLHVYRLEPPVQSERTPFRTGFQEACTTGCCWINRLRNRGTSVRFRLISFDNV